MDVLDPTRLSEIKVDIVDIAALAGIDYVEMLCTTMRVMPDMFYIVTDYRLTSPDIATLYVTPDYVLSNGGYSSLTFLDGVIERTTNPDDKKPSIALDDEYTAPHLPLSVDFAEVNTRDDTASMMTNDTIVVESTADLVDPIDWKESNVLTAPSKTTGGTEMYQLNPKLNHVVGRTTYQVGINGNYKHASAPGTRQYFYSQAIGENIDELQQLGVTGALISSVVYPGEYFDSSSFLSSGDHVSQIKSNVTSHSVNMGGYKPYTNNYSYTPDNVQLYVNTVNKYGIVTASGEQAEYNFNEIVYDSGKNIIGAYVTQSPTVLTLADPRPTGKPYFRFRNYLRTGDSSDIGTLNVFFRGCLSGLQWSNAQLTYQGASGSYFNTLRYGLNQKSAALDYNKQYESNASAFRSAYYDITNTRSNAFVNATGSALSLAFGDSDKKIGAISSIGTSLNNLTKAEANWNETKTMYANTNSYNQQAYALNQELAAANYAEANMVAPTVAFPFNADAYRDFIGNGCLVYRYYYKEDDLKRIDKLLNMYGVKTCRQMTSADFSQRTKFDYVRAGGVSVSNENLPMFVREAIGSALSVGIRVWHTKPSNSYYAAGGNPSK